MSVLNVRKFYRAKTLLITGASGFVGKVLLWTVLTHLDLKKVYVILRDKRDKHGNIKTLASDRLEMEVWKCRIFEKVSSEKRAIVTACQGDIETDGLGLNAEDHKTLTSEVEVIIHAAASVRFQATLKDNLNTNTFGSLRVLELAKACNKLEALVHVSTAYVNSDLGTGLVVEEKAFPPLSSSEEMLSLLTRVTSLESPPAGTDEVLKKLQGSHFNTYTFTKQLAEDLILERKGSLKVGIVRPTIVGSAWRQPLFGWVDSPLAAGALFAAGATGLINICPGRPHLIGDQIPVDFVCNCAIVMGAAVALDMAPRVYEVRRKTAPGRSAWPVDQPCKAETQNVIITQVSSSTTNPVSWKYTIDIVQGYFQANPLTKANCRVPRFSFVESTIIFRLIFLIGTLIPATIYLYIVQVAALVSSRFAGAYQHAQRNVKMANLGLNIAFAFAPFTSLEWYFDNRNTLALYRLLDEDEQKIFYLDSRVIEWREWLVGYCQGLRTEVLKEPLPPNPAYTGRGPEAVETLHKVDDSKPTEIITNSLKETESTQKVIAMACRSSSASSKSVEWMGAKFNPFWIVPTALVFHKVLDELFRSILIDRESAQRLTKVVQSLPNPPPRSFSHDDLDEYRNPHPILLLPTHKSYFDFIILSYLCLALELRLPMVAANRASLPLLSHLLRACGAFFNSPDRTYFREALQFHAWVEFFIEGRRSRTGYIQAFTNELLKTAMDLLSEGRIETLRVVPIAINYGEMREAENLCGELLGHPKKEAGIVKGLWDLLVERVTSTREIEELRTCGVSVKVGTLQTFTVDDVGDLKRVSGQIIRQLQDLRQLSPKDVFAWALLAKENQSTPQLTAKVKDIVNYLEVACQRDMRPKVFGVLPHRLEEQIEAYLLKHSPFCQVFEQSAHVISDEIDAHASLDTLPSAIDAEATSSKDKLTRKVWAPKWAVAVPKFNKHMNHLQFFQNGALDLVGVDAVLACVILTRRRSHQLTHEFIINELHSLTKYFQATALGRRILHMGDDQLLVIARRLINSDTQIVSLLRGLMRPVLHGAKSIMDALANAKFEESMGLDQFIHNCRTVASTSPCGLGTFPLIDAELVRSALSALEHPEMTTICLSSLSQNALQHSLTFLKAYMDE